VLERLGLGPEMNCRAGHDRLIWDC
jgi:hypothetical protein